MESHSTSLVFPPTTSFRFLFRSDNEDAALPFSCRGRTSACGVVQPMVFYPSSPPHWDFAFLIYVRTASALAKKRSALLKKKGRAGCLWAPSAASACWTPTPVSREDPIKKRELLRGSILPSRRAALLYVIVVCHVVSSPLHRRVPMHYVPVH